MLKKGPARSPDGQLQLEAMVAITLVELPSSLTHLAGFPMLMATWVGRLPAEFSVCQAGPHPHPCLHSSPSLCQPAFISPSRLPDYPGSVTLRQSLRNCKDIHSAWRAKVTLESLPPRGK